MVCKVHNRRFVSPLAADQGLPRVEMGVALNISRLNFFYKDEAAANDGDHSPRKVAFSNADPASRIPWRQLHRCVWGRRSTIFCASTSG
jgi:hypothetical protein